MFQLTHLGWDTEFQTHLASLTDPTLVPARVAHESRGHYGLWAETGPLEAQVAGRLRYVTDDPAALPAVGDWVACRPSHPGSATIHAVLPRRSAFSRKVAGRLTVEQVVAANLDTVFVAMALNQDFNLRRLERYMVLAWDSGAMPVILLTKADLCGDPAERLDEVRAIAPGVPLHVLSSLTGEGVEALRAYLPLGKTAALLGSSGVGKSTLFNRLMGTDLQATGEIREGDGRGKHTTTRRELFLMPQGGLLIDTPGMRELGLWQGEEGLREAFDEIADLAETCRFRDCRHDREPGCSVREAIESGELDPARLASYAKLQREQAHQARRHDAQARQQEKRRHKQATKAHDQRPKP